MKKNMLLLLGLFSTVFVFARIEPRSEALIDWSEYRMYLDITTDSDSRPVPADRYRSMENIEMVYPEIFMEYFLSLPLNSRTDVLNRIMENPQLYLSTQNQIESLPKEYARPSIDLKSITIRYEIDLLQLAIDVLDSPSQGYSPPVPLEWNPGADFTGIVIYASEPLPLHGTGEEVELQPCFFPRIFNEDMEILAEEPMLSSEQLSLSGIAAYSAETDLSGYVNRIGYYPLKIFARKIYGINRTDLVITNEDADIILARPETRDLLTSGRILILCPESVQTIAPSDF